MYLENYGTLCGYLAHDCEIKTRNDGSKEFVVFTVCFNTTYKDTEKPNFFDVAYFGNDSLALSKSLKKGSLVRVHYSLRDDKWADEQGKVHRSISLIAERVEVLQTFKREQAPQEGN